MKVIDYIKSFSLFKRLSKTKIYIRFRPLLGGLDYLEIHHDNAGFLDDGVAPELINWPLDKKKPNVGLIRDYGASPKWPKYVRFLNNNNIPFDFYNIQLNDWLERAREFDMVIGSLGSSAHCLDEQRRKFHILTDYLGIICYPTFFDSMLYEDKFLEAYLSKIHDFPFINTFISNNFDDAVSKTKKLKFPLVNKTVPGSGSVGVELINSYGQCLNILKKVFSPNGRITHTAYLRQKNYIYIQDYIKNDGNELRVIVVANMVFGYYRKVPRNDFRASGMDKVEKRELPAEALKLARLIYNKLNSTMLVIDMLRDEKGDYHIIEFSPFCRIDTSEQLHVNGIPGVYIFEDDDSFRFEKGKFWVDELALKHFFNKIYIANN